MAVCYKASRPNPQSFQLDQANLKSFTFSIVIYGICGTLCLVLLVVRRNMSLFGNAELGGTKIPKYASGFFLFFLWFVYIVLNILKTSTSLLDGFM